MPQPHEANPIENYLRTEPVPSRQGEPDVAAHAMEYDSEVAKIQIRRAEKLRAEREREAAAAAARRARKGGLH